MAYEISGFDYGTLQANVDLSGNQFYCAIQDPTTGNVLLAGAAQLGVIGVIQNKPKATQAVTLRHTGITKASCGAAVTRGDALQTAATGRVITRTATNPIIGYALDTTTAAGQLATCLLGQ